MERKLHHSNRVVFKSVLVQKHELARFSILNRFLHIYTRNLAGNYLKA